MIGYRFESCPVDFALTKFPREDRKMTKKLQSVEGKIEVVELSQLNIDNSYQRPLKKHHRKIANEFNPSAAGILHVGRRADNTLWLIDGQQRRAAMEKVGITKWKALVIHSSGQVYEATIFKMLNGRDTRAGLNPVELFRACVTAQDPIAEADAISHHIPRAMIRLYGRQGELINDERMEEVLSKVAPRKIINDSTLAIGDRYTAMVSIICRMYNRRLSPKNQLKIVSEAA